MSVLIKGVDTPLTCWGCPCFDDEITHYCCVLDRYCDDYKNNRLNDCPLVEVPTPHGRLIDADNVSSDAMCSHCVEEYCRNNCECFIENVQTILSNELITPTVIEAEVSE